MKNVFLFSIIASLVLFSHTFGNEQRALNVVPQVDLKRYMGTWYEIARLPNTFQKQCMSDVTAIYEMNEKDEISVTNQCLTEDGMMSKAQGEVKKSSDTEPNSKLKVRFAPAFLSFLPFVWGDYWILQLGEDYSYAVIGEPDRKYLWILSRTQKMDETLYQSLLTKTQEQGYDISNLQRTIQTIK